MTRVARMTWPVDMAVVDSRLGGCRSRPVDPRRSAKADVRQPGEGLCTVSVDQSSGEGSILVSGAGPGGGAAYFMGSASLVASKTDSSLVLSKIICSRDSPVKS